MRTFKLYYLIVCILSGHLFSQNVPNPFEIINEEYTNGKMGDKIFFNKIDSVAFEEINKNHTYSITQMIANLKLYEELAWSNDDYDLYRENYYISLLNNAYFSHLRGASIYYAEKVKNISANGKRSRPTIELNVKVDIYTLQNRFDKVALAYENEKLYFKELVSKAKDEPQNHFLKVLDALSLLKTVYNAYANLNDDYHCNEVYQIANQLADAIHEVKHLSNDNLLLKDFTLLTLQYYHDCYTKDYSKALATLNQIDALKNKYSNLSTELIRNHVYEWKTSLYIELGQIDSAQFYIKKLEKIPQFIESQKVWLYKHKAKLALLDDNGLEANKWLEAALKESENIQNLLATQMDDLLYTQTEGEHYLIALKNSEIKRLQKNRWILIISIVSVILILGITLYWIYKENKLKKRINELNEASEFQIILMEQIEEKIRNEERELLSQNLHDDLAGSLIAIKNNLEVYSQEYSSLKLKELSEYVAQTYLNVRNKSHLLNEIANMSNEKIFSNHIIKLANIAFPSPIYKFKFLLDPNCLDHTSLILKSDLLRVINELFSNIIKHSKSTEVELLFYREIDGLYISIKNNKVFFNNNKNFSNKGLHFINKRLKKYNAVVNYKLVNQNFEIIIYIPHSNLYN